MTRFIDGGAETWTFDSRGQLVGGASGGDQGTQCWGTLLYQACGDVTVCLVNPDYLRTGELCAQDDGGVVGDDAGA